jgi:hypothetical protein
LYVEEYFCPLIPNYVELKRLPLKTPLGCDFFGWKTNTQTHKRTFRNIFFQMVSFVFLAPLGDFLLVPKYANMQILTSPFLPYLSYTPAARELEELFSTV